MSHSLITSGVLRVRTAQGVECLSLPQALARLARDEIESWEGLQHWQHPSWHMFLVQIAAAALNHMGTTEIPDNPGAWAECLLHLADGEQPWELVPEDPEAGGFMQTPDPGIPEGKLGAWKTNKRGWCRYPDVFTTLILAKNHDIKLFKVHEAEPDHWIYALVEQQTSAGYMGRFCYGVTRIPGGAMHRIMVGFTKGYFPGSRWRRDVEALLEVRDEIAETYGYPKENGLCLTWTAPWDSSKDFIARDTLDPLHIETSRRVRLRMNGEGIIEGAQRPSENFITAGPSGVVGDFWGATTLKKGEPFKTLALSEYGWSMARRVQIFFGDEELRISPAGKYREGDTHWRAVGMARGQGTTFGFLEVLVEIPIHLRGDLLIPERMEFFHKRALRMLELRELFVKKVLRSAVCMALLGEDMTRWKRKDPSVQMWLKRFNKLVDADFWSLLWEGGSVGAPGNEDPGVNFSHANAWIGAMNAHGETLRTKLLALRPGGAEKYARAVHVLGIYRACYHKHIIPQFDPMEEEGNV